jgi:hypothetical protein
MDVSTDELLSAERAFTYADLYAIWKPNIPVVWLTPHAAVVRGVKVYRYPWDHPNVVPLLRRRRENNMRLVRSHEHLLRFSMSSFDCWQ